ncbi:MAG TPA: primosomal protein N' [Wenzhouxiangellaceae bacterium]|nr:primosomal protein N' [Wenzhouxiangellaceae bacterium]
MAIGIVQVAVPVPLYRFFDYLPPAGKPSPPPGSRVLVPFGNRKLVGVVIGRSSASEIDPARVKSIERTFETALVGEELLSLIRWTTRYYAAPPGELVNHALPAVLRRNREMPTSRIHWLHLTPAGAKADLTRAPRQREVAEQLQAGAQSREALSEAGASTATLRRMLDTGLLEACRPPRSRPAPGPRLNPDQRAALAAILRARNRFETLLLAGVTGSGKTEVYLQAARHLLRRGRQILVLVPEIGLTPQFVRRLEARLGHKAHVFHSGLGERERLETWQAAGNGEGGLLIGTRSAVFLPLKQPGLLIVDEEHDGSFKQFDAMRYHARDVAVLRASRLNIPVVLGSATPSLESLHNAERGRYRMLLLPERAGSSGQPHWRIDDPRGQRVEHGLTEKLVERIGKTLAGGEQVLVYRNRRGYAPVLICNECGWQADCDHCSAHLTWHRSAHRLNCHHCGRYRSVPARCPECQSPQLQAVGAGTERIEIALKELFPDHPVLRADRDVVRGRDDFEALLDQVATGDPCILVGTQMLAKGHHLPGIGLAIMLDTDQLLFSADFRAPERLAQSIVQVAGRAGREQQGRFILQSRHPEHPLIQTLASGDYLRAARLMLEERRDAGLPPWQNLAMVRAEAPKASDAAGFLREVARRIDRPSLQVAGPLAAILQRRAGFWRYQLWLMSESRTALGSEIARLTTVIEGMREARTVRWHIDVDPMEV